MALIEPYRPRLREALQVTLFFTLVMATTAWLLSMLGEGFFAHGLVAQLAVLLALSAAAYQSFRLPFCGFRLRLHNILGEDITRQSEARSRALFGLWWRGAVALVPLVLLLANLAALVTKPLVIWLQPYAERWGAAELQLVLDFLLLYGGLFLLVGLPVVFWWLRMNGKKIRIVAVRYAPARFAENQLLNSDADA